MAERYLIAVVRTEKFSDVPALKPLNGPYEGLSPMSASSSKRYYLDFKRQCKKEIAATILKEWERVEGIISRSLW